MAIKFYNTLTREKEEFRAIDDMKVGLYTCGPTVYDYAHIGNLRTFLFEDILRRVLEYHGFDVRHIMNLTDVDDKTIRGSQAQGISLTEYTAKYIEGFFNDLDKLDIESAENYPAATAHVPEMVMMIEKLMEKGIAYRTEDGSIYFDISKFPGYGKLSHFKVEELRAGARVKSDEYEKAQVSDFALWKAWDEADGDVFWVTEIGKGRPGWHIECSAMSMEYLGQTFDIHTGGVDNIFPHHENEIAQAEATTGRKFVNYWIHAEHLQVDGRKMSKSLGNFYTLRDIEAKGYDPLAFRYLVLGAHYRAKLNFTWKAMDTAQTTLQNLYEFMGRLDRENPSGLDDAVTRAKQAFEEGIDDDLNTPVALAAVFGLIKEANIHGKPGKEVWDAMFAFDKVLGLRLAERAVRNVVIEVPTATAVLGAPSPTVSVTSDFVLTAVPQEILDLLDQRQQARKAKDFATSDRIRDELAARGWVIEDTPQGPRVKKS